MGKIKFGADSVPSTLEEDTIVIVDGVTYVGNSSNEPELSKGYKEYTAIISQSSTNAPTDTVIKNDFNDNISWSRTGVGGYSATLAGAFTPNKTFVTITQDTDTVKTNGSISWISFLTANTISENSISFNVTASYKTGTPTSINDLEGTVYLSIKVYY